MPDGTTCSEEGCDGPIKARGLCRRHYLKMWRHGNTVGIRGDRGPATKGRICIRPDCDEPVSSKDLCRRHYRRLRRSGSSEMAYRQSADDVAFITSLTLEADQGCVVWPWRRNRQGYGLTAAMGEVLAHRVSCRIHHGEPPEDKPLALHSCGKGHEGCVAPWHLYWGDKSENSFDAVEHGTHKIGEQVWNARLRREDINPIRNDPRPADVIGAEYGVARQTINDIQFGRTWKHVPWE